MSRRARQARIDRAGRTRTQPPTRPRVPRAADGGPRPRILLPYADDSTLFFAHRMRGLLSELPDPPEVVTAWYMPEWALSYRQLRQFEPDGADRSLTGPQFVAAILGDEFDGVLASRVFRPLLDVLRRPERHHSPGRAAIGTFLGGLDFFPREGFANRRAADLVYLFPRSLIGEFEAGQTGPEEGPEGWQRVGFGHPAFLRPEARGPIPDRGAPRTLASRAADPARGRPGGAAPLPPVPMEQRTDVFFFAQALSPATKSGRRFVLRSLAAIARANPDRDVWIKLRHLPGENAAHKHRELHDYPSLMTGEDWPANLRLTACTMDEALESAAIGITCTSTAAIDLVRDGVPTLVWLDYPGHRFDALVPPMRRLFAGSGLVRPLQDVLHLRSAPPDPAWVKDMFCPRDLGARVLSDIAEFHARPFRLARPPELT